MAIQVIRRTQTTWDVTRVRLIWHEQGEDAHSYETIGRIVFDGGLYYAELPDWKADETFDWKRQPRGYQLLRGALRTITNPVKAEKVLQ